MASGAPNPDPWAYFCYFCGQPGHTQRGCALWFRFLEGTVGVEVTMPGDKEKDGAIILTDSSK